MKNKINHLNELLSVIKESNFSKNDFCIVGSSLLSIYSLRKNNDIDIVLKNKYKRGNREAYNLSSKIEVVGDDWAHKINLSDNELIDNYEYHFIYEGFKVIRLEVMLALYIKKNKRNDVNLIEDFLSDNEAFDWQLFIDLISRSPKQINHKYIKKIKKGIKNPKKGFNFIFKKISNKFKLENQFKKNSNYLPHYKKIDLGILLSKQIHNNSFSRYDFLIRYLVVKSILEKKEFIYGYRLKEIYSKMQNDRVNKNTFYKFLKLIYSYKDKGFSNNFPIPITKDGIILDGAHRIACALYFQDTEIPVRIKYNNNKKNVDYKRYWFINKGFPKDFIEEVDKVKDKLFLETGVFFNFMLWPSVSKYYFEILSIIENKYEIIDQELLDLGDSFDKFIDDIYKMDDIDRWKVELKKSLLKKYNNKVFNIIIKIEDPKYRIKSQSYGYICEQIEELKRIIRQSYKNKVDNYYYDIICHGADNPEHNRKILSIISNSHKDGKNNG